MASSAALRCCILFLLLSKYDNHQRDMLHRLRLLRELETLPTHAAILLQFSTNELVPFPFAGSDELLNALATPRHAVAEASHESDAYFRDQLQPRVVQFNLIVVSKYYSRIHTTRLAGLLGLSTDRLEEYLSDVSHVFTFVVV